MKNLKETILEKLYHQQVDEKLIINKYSKAKSPYTCQPKDWDELRKIIEERLKKDKDADLNDIDVSQITYMYNEVKDKGLFEGLDPHNIKIDKWDVSKVIHMGSMFFMCKNFNCDLSKWDVSNVQYMFHMFNNCYNFDSDLSNWDVKNVRNIRCMFNKCYSFTGKGLENWDIRNVNVMSNTFDDCDSLKNKPSWYKN